MVHGESTGNVAQATCPSMPLHNDQHSNYNSSSSDLNTSLPTDPSMAAASLTLLQHQPYTPKEAQPSYSSPPDGLPGHYQIPSTHIPASGHAVMTGPSTPAIVSLEQLPPTASCCIKWVQEGQYLNDFLESGPSKTDNYKFVSIPGGARQKRKRRQPDEIERKYKCGHNGCEKAYGTLNHLNNHISLKSHGQKREERGKQIYS